MASLIGALINAYGEAETGIANRNVGEYNQRVNERNAVIATQEGDAQAKQEGRMAEKRIGLARANFAASGVTMEGTASDVLAESASNAKLNEQNIKFNANLRAIGFRENATLDAFRAHYMLTASQYAAAAPLISGGTKEYDRQTGPKGSGTPVDGGGGGLGSTPNDDVATSEYGTTYDYGGDE